MLVCGVCLIEYQGNCLLSAGISTGAAKDTFRMFHFSRLNHSFNRKAHRTVLGAALTTDIRFAYCSELE